MDPQQEPVYEYLHGKKHLLIKWFPYMAKTISSLSLMKKGQAAL